MEMSERAGRVMAEVSQGLAGVGSDGRAVR